MTVPPPYSPAAPPWTSEEWPARIATSELVGRVAELHRKPEDLEEGDLAKRLWRFPVYELRRLPVAEFWLGEWDVDEALVDRYVARIGGGEVPPPVVFDGLGQSTIDGIHRLNAVARSGARTVWVYVGAE